MSVRAQFIDTGSLTVTKSITGVGAGAQGEIRITVTCNEAALPDFAIPAGTTGTVTRTYDDIPTPATCTVTETVDGANAAVTVVTVNGSQTVAIPIDEIANDPVDAQPITDTYDTVATTTTTTTTTATAPTTGPTVSAHQRTEHPAAGHPARHRRSRRPDHPAGFAAVVAGGLLVWLTRRRTTS